MADFVKVATTDKIPAGKKMKVEVRGYEIFLANVEGKIYALNNICSHEQCGLDEGDLEGSTITCTCHGAKYDVRTGVVHKETPWGIGQDTFEVKVEGKDIFVEV